MRLEIPLHREDISGVGQCWVLGQGAEEQGVVAHVLEDILVVVGDVVVQAAVERDFVGGQVDVGQLPVVDQEDGNEDGLEGSEVGHGQGVLRIWW